MEEISSANPNTSLIAVVFYLDLFNPYLDNTLNESTILNLIINRIENRVIESKQPFYFLYSNHIVRSLLHKSKTSPSNYFFKIRLFEKLDELSQKYDNFFRIDLDEIFSDIGLASSKCTFMFLN